MSTAMDTPAPGRRLERHAPTVIRAGIACLAAAVVVALAAHVGGYLPSAWGLIAVGGAVVGAAALAVGRPAGLRRIEAGWLGCLVALGGWQLLSLLWASGDGGAVADAQVTLLYAVCAAAILALVGRDDAESLVLGVAAGTLIVSLWGLGRHLLPETLGGEGPRLENPRLAGPMGYANAAGVLAAIGLLLCLAVVTHRGRVLQALAGAAAAPLAVTLYLTLSRGAMVGTVVGLVVLALADRRRLDLAVSVAVVAVPTALAVWLAGRLPGVTGSPPYDVMRADGRTLALELIPVAVLGAAMGAGRGLVPTLGGRSRRHAARAALIAVVVVAAGAGLVLAREGGPVDLVRRAVDSFSAAPPADANASARLLSGSGTVRSAYWGVARDMVAREPLLGEGAGSYERWWIQERPEESGVRNAHNLYLEMLAETGPLALVLVLAFVALPFVALRRGRSAPLAPAAAAAFAIVAAQAALDWDWEIPVVMLPALALGAVPLVAGRHAAAGAAPRRLRAAAGGAALIAALSGVAVHIGNSAFVRADDAFLAEDLAEAADQVRTAVGWQPWSAAPLRLRAEIRMAGEDVAGARTDLRAAARRDPESWETWFDLALVTSGKEQAEAVARARELNPRGSEIALLDAP